MIRIRILQAPPLASIDGVRLDCFHPGVEYEVGNLVGALFLSEGWAEPVALSPPAASVTPDAAAGAPIRRDHPPNLERDTDPPYFQHDPDKRTDLAADSNRRRPKQR